VAVIIRERASEHLPGCVDALRQVHEADGYPVRWPADPVAWLVPPNALTAYVAVAAAKVVGQVVVRDATPPASVASLLDPALGAPAMLSRLFTVPAARRKGVAQRLVEEVQRWAADHGTQLFLDVADDAPAARRLYERLGWRQVASELADWLGAEGRPALVHWYLYSGSSSRNDR